MSVINVSKARKETSTTFARSQLILFRSRMKWGVVYCLATIAGIFLIQDLTGLIAPETQLVTLIQRIAPLPIISLLVTTGMFLLNDILDVDLDRANGKKRPLSSRQVTTRQGWIFIVWTNAAAVLLAIITANPMSMMLVIPMLAIGIMYSAPKTALDDRFVVKTSVIALYYVLCAALGFTALYSIGAVPISPLIIVYATIVLGGMRFISSVLNDTGDVDGDKAARRRTIPIVIGKENTVKMMIGIASAIIVASVAFYIIGGIEITLVVPTGVIAVFLIRRLTRILKGVNNRDSVREEHKKLLPFDLLFLASMAAGSALDLVVAPLY